jgi:hypothetical protein
VRSESPPGSLQGVVIDVDCSAGLLGRKRSLLWRSRRRAGVQASRRWLYPARLATLVLELVLVLHRLLDEELGFRVDLYLV